MDTPPAPRLQSWHAQGAPRSKPVEVQLIRPPPTLIMGGRGSIDICMRHECSLISSEARGFVAWRVALLGARDTGIRMREGGGGRTGDAFVTTAVNAQNTQ